MIHYFSSNNWSTCPDEWKRFVNDVWKIYYAQSPPSSLPDRANGKEKNLEDIIAYEASKYGLVKTPTGHYFKSEEFKTAFMLRWVSNEKVS